MQVLEKSKQQVIASEYNANTKEALTKGILELHHLLWKMKFLDDRLEDAIEYLRERKKIN